MAMYAQKGNKVIVVDEYSKAQYLNQGYDIVENGKVVAYGKGKVISPAMFLQLQEENEKLKAELESLKAKKSEKKEKK